MTTRVERHIEAPRSAVYAALLILIVLFMPKGIYGTLRDRFRS